MATLLWLQTGACSGDTMSLLTADSPSIERLTADGTLVKVAGTGVSGNGQGELLEVLSGLRAGDVVLISQAPSDDERLALP